MKKAVFLLALMVALPALANTVNGVALCSSEGELNFSFDMPIYEVRLSDGGEAQILVPDEHVSYSAEHGYPKLPSLTYTFALPPGSKLEEVDFSGFRSVVPGNYIIQAALPPFTSTSDVLSEELFSQYNERKTRIYSGLEKLPQDLGILHSTGERREYSLITVTLNPFFFDPVTSTLSAADNIQVKLRYSPADPEHAEFISRFIEGGTICHDVPEHIFNKEDARNWYKPDQRLLANPRMIILTTNAIKNSDDSKIGLYREWRSYNGINTTVVTTEEIEASTEGADLPQKIRNWLRANASSYDYLFIIGMHKDIPMRTLTPFNNNCKTNDPDVTPNPSDIYYGDLSSADNLSWNKDGDAYYGESMSAAGFLDQQDKPDFEMELHVGRINSSIPSTIGKILERTWLFEYDKNASYKNASVLAGGILWFHNWNGNPATGFDAATYMEYLINNSVVSGTVATTLYEKEGKSPSAYTCDLNLTQDNLVNSLKNDVGIFVENNHGFEKAFHRCVWSNDDGDNIPEDPEFTWPEALKTTDVWKFESGKANVAFLLSCLNGKPESDPCLAQALLNYGSVGVVAHTRSALGQHNWTTPADGGQNALYYYVLENYLKNSTTYDYVLGDAVDAGRLNYYTQEKSTYSRFINVYEHVIFGDPSLRHMGRNGNLPIGVEEEQPVVAPPTLFVDAGHNVTFNLPSSNTVRLEVWDAAGRKLQTLANCQFSEGTHRIQWNSGKLASGSYFITLKSDNKTCTSKAVVIH